MISCLYMFVTFITIFSFFSNGYSNLTTIEILVLLSWIPASKEFLRRIYFNFLLLENNIEFNKAANIRYQLFFCSHYDTQ